MSADHDPSRAAQRELGEQLSAAAVRRHAEQRARTRRRRRIGLPVIVATLLGVATVAGAARLITTGEPLLDQRSTGTQYRPVAGAPVLDSQARDAERNVTWGVGVYKGENGQACAIAGEVVGRALGRIEGGVFHPYERDFAGACGDLGKLSTFSDLLRVPGAHPRTIVYGRVRAGQEVVSVTHEGRTQPAKVGRGGGFLFVFEGRLDFADVQVRAGA